MPLRVGTIVKPYEYDVSDLGSMGYFPCEQYNRGQLDVPVKLNVCVGIIRGLQRPDKTEDPEAIVAWMTRCTYHRRLDKPDETIENIHYLWEVGQLA